MNLYPGVSERLVVYFVLTSSALKAWQKDKPKPQGPPLSSAASPYIGHHSLHIPSKDFLGLRGKSKVWADVIITVTFHIVHSVWQCQL